MSSDHALQRMGQLAQGFLGPKRHEGVGREGRVRHVRAATTIGIVVGVQFSIFNLLTDGMMALGLTELAAVLFLLVPAAVISRTPQRVGLAESLLLLAALVIFGALIVLGGIEGTGLFWVYTAPFLAFFLKGQRLGWWLSLSYLALITLYMVGVSPILDFSYRYTPVVTTHFLLSFGFYTLVAAAFNHVRSRYEAQLQQGKEQAEAAYRLKSRFLAAASHDLRQPAHALGMFVARLTQLPQDPPARKLIASVDASVRALQEMLDAFFDYSRLDAPSMQVRLSAFALDGLFQQLHNSLAGAAAEKGLRLRIRSSRAWVRSDPVLLQRILLNLVGNAVQHTAHGSVLVSCRPTHDGTHARIEVRDSGIGIAPEHHTKIFEEFFQVENPERDRIKGLGLGLSIVERSCKLLNLPLTMRSGLGCGTSFTLRVPLAPAQPPNPALYPCEIQPMNELECLRILVVEDDELGSAALAGLLTSWGCEVTVAGDAQTACELLRQIPTPDFIVSDYRLRGLQNGIEAVRLLREVSGQTIAACVISGDTEADVRQHTRAAGLLLLQKPVRPGKLRSLLRNFVQTRSSPTDETSAP